MDQNRNPLPHDYYGPCQVITCDCTVSERIRRRLPSNYQGAGLIQFSKETVDSVTNWLASGTLGLVLNGPAGTGKTHLAAAITRALIELRQDAEFYEMAEIYRRVRNSFNRESETPEADILAGYIRVPWLTLDDFGAGALTDFERRCALEILNGRINEQRRTIVTTNLDLDEIRDRMDERISSRLGSFIRMQTGGRDRRKASP